MPITDVENMKEKMQDFLLDNKISFESFVRCCNFRQDMTKEQYVELLDAYREGKFRAYGHY